MRRKGYRMNLRGLAERQTLLWIGIVVFSFWLLCQLLAWLSSINSDSVSSQLPVEQLEAQRRYMSSHATTHRFDARNPSTYKPKYTHDNF